MGILTKITGADRREDRIAEKVAAKLKDVAITPTSPTLMKIFGWGKDGEDSLTSPYAQLPIIYAAIRAVGKVLSQTDLVVMRGETEVGPNDPIAQLFKKPNPYQSPYKFKEALGTNIQVKGNAYIVLSEETVRGVPLEIKAWPAAYFTPRFDDNGEWLGWWVKRGKAPKAFYPPELVVHTSTYNPNDEILGLAPLDVLKMTYSGLWDSLVYNKKFFENDGAPPFVYIAKGGLSPQQRQELTKNLIDRRAGKQNAFKAQLVEGDMDVKVLGFTQKDIQFLEGIKQHEGDVLMVFGVTKTQVSKYEDVNFATALSQDKVFITNTCLPMMRQIESDINSQWLNALGYSVRFDERSNAAMTYLASDEATKVTGLSSGGIVTINEARDMIGMDPVEWGDEQPKATLPPAPPPQFVPGQPPMPGMPMMPPQSDMPTKSVDAEKMLDAEVAKARRTNTWNALNRIVMPIEKRCAAAVRKYFFDVERKVEARVGKAFTEKAADRVPLEDLFDDGKLYKIIKAHAEESVASGAGTLNVQINLEDPGIQQYLANRVQFMRGINDNAKAQIQEKLDKLLQQAMAESWTEQQRTDAIRTMLGEEFKSLSSHARSIARTEVHGAFSEGRWEAVKELEPNEIEWVSSRDALVRDSHAALDGHRVKPGESFGNGLRYPLDPLGSADQVVNCRCTFSVHF